MVRRPWIILVSLILLFLAFSGLITFRYINRSNVLKNRILSELSSIDGDFSIKRARLLSNNLVLNQVSYRSPDSTVALFIDEISLGLSLGTLLQNSDNIVGSIESVSIDMPTVSYRPDRKISGSFFENQNNDAAFNLSGLESLERVILLNGSFRMLTGRNNEWISITHLDGWLTSINNDRFDVDVSAIVADDTLHSLQANGSGSILNQLLNLRVELLDFDLSHIRLPKVSPVNDFAGMFDFQGSLTLDSSGWDAKARWMIRDAEALIDESGGLVLDRINLDGTLEDRIATSEGIARFEGDEAVVDGMLDFDEFTFTGTANATEVRIGHHLGTFAQLESKLQPRGNVSTQARLNIDLHTLELDLEAVAIAEQLDTEVGPFNNIQLNYSWDNQRWELRFDSLATSWYGLDITGNGRFRPSEEITFIVDGTFTGNGKQGNLPDWMLPIEDKDADGELIIRKMPLEGFVVSGEARVRDQYDPAIGEFHGRYSTYGFDTSLDLYSLRRPDAHIRLQQFMDDPIQLRTVQPQLAISWWDDDIEIHELISDLNIQSRSNIDRGEISTIASINTGESGFGLKVSGVTSIDSGLVIETVAGFELSKHRDFIANGEIETTFHDGVLDLSSLKLMDVVTASGSIDFKQKRLSAFTTRIIDLDLSYLLPELTSITDGMVDGNINGRLIIDGPFDQPGIESHFELSEGRYRDVDGYWGLFTANTVDDGMVSIQQGALGRGSSTLFTLIGEYSIPLDSMGVYVASPNSDAQVLMYTLTGRDDMLDGNAELHGFIHGPFMRPSWEANLELSDGRVAGIHYEDVLLEARGTNTDRLGKVVYIDSALFSRPEHYELSLHGAIPLDRGAGELDISLNGDVLELLPQWSDFIETASGQGSLDWTTTFVAGKPVATRGELSVQDGNIDFADVLPPMSELNIDVTIDADGLVNIRDLKGLLDQQYPFEISNLPGDTENLDRQPIQFSMPEINLGVLKIRTHEDLGIPFHLPGINTTEQYARLAVSGKDDDWLTIAGPAEALYIDGELTLLSANFTYPPISEESDVISDLLTGEPIFSLGQESNDMVEIPSFINNTRWDVDAYLGNDIRYERVIKGLENAPVLETISEFLGQIVLDVDLDPSDQEFPINVSGVLADTSFRLNGTITSTTGRIEFLDLLFMMDRAEVVFDPTTIYPVVSARAMATVEEVDYSRQMYLTLYVIDPVTGERQQRGRWGEFTFVLEDELGSSQEEVLNDMGVGITDLQGLQNRFITAGAGGIDRAMARRWLGPIERDAANWLGVDILQFRPQIATNLVGTNPADVFYNTASDDQRTAANQSNRNLFRASKVTLGKYLDRDIYVSYTGQFGEEARYASVEDIQLGRLGLLQQWNLEYRIEPISPNFVIEFGWEYENVEDRNNRSARMKYSVVFDLMNLNTNSQWQE